MSTPDTNTLTQVLAAKCELLMQLRQLGQQQSQLIEAAELGQLLNLLATKQRLLHGLQTIERQLDPFRGQLPEQRQWHSADDRQRCADLAAACEKLLMEVMASERYGQEQLILRRDEAATQLQVAHFAAQAHDAYVKPNQFNISQFDSSME